jgi:hypothetical protein
LTVDRATPVEIVDFGTFVAAMMLLQELAAGLMTAPDENSRLSLTEHVSSEEIEKLASDVFGDKVAHHGGARLR